MSDTVKSWIEERRAIHAQATEGPWETGEVINWGDANDVPQVPVLSRNRAITWDDHGGEVFKPEDGNAIVDAHNTLPTLLTAVEKVLELHKPVHQVFSWQAGGTTAYDPCETCHGKAGVHECGCWADKDLVYTCAECRNDKGRDIDWPCATVQAIEGAIND